MREEVPKARALARHGVLSDRHVYRTRQHTLEDRNVAQRQIVDCLEWAGAVEKVVVITEAHQRTRLLRGFGELAQLQDILIDAVGVPVAVHALICAPVDPTWCGWLV